MTSSVRREKSLARKKSRKEVPVHEESRFGAPRLAVTSSRWTVLKSILNRVLPEVLGTVECIWASEKGMTPPTGQTGRSCGSSSTGSTGRGSGRGSALTYCAAAARWVLFHV